MGPAQNWYGEMAVAYAVVPNGQPWVAPVEPDYREYCVPRSARVPEVDEQQPDNDSDKMPLVHV